MQEGTGESVINKIFRIPFSSQREEAEEPPNQNLNFQNKPSTWWNRN